MNSDFVVYGTITDAWLNRDMHLHTNQTDGFPTIEEVIRRAEELELGVIAFTEHVRADSDWFPAFAAAVRETAAGSPVRVLVGAEAAIMDFDGNLNISDTIRSLSDIVVASVHRFPDHEGGGRRAFKDVPHDEFAEIEFRMALGLLKNGKAHVLGHPGGMSRTHVGGFPAEYDRELMLATHDSGIAFEINTSYIRDMPSYVGRLAEANPLVSLGSDAHRLEDLGTCRVTMRSIL